VEKDLIKFKLYTILIKYIVIVKLVH